MLGDKAYDSAELRENLHERGTKPVIPNRCNRKQPFSFSKRIYKLRRALTQGKLRWGTGDGFYSSHTEAGWQKSGKRETSATSFAVSALFVPIPPRLNIDLRHSFAAVASSLHRGVRPVQAAL
jgi:hypothetical protein